MPPRAATACSAGTCSLQYPRLQVCLGHTALCLSGGGALAMYHMGVIKALIENGARKSQSVGQYHTLAWSTYTQIRSSRV